MLDVFTYIYFPFTGILPSYEINSVVSVRDTVDIVLQQKHSVCVRALSLVESFMPQFFLEWGHEQSSATCAVTVPRKYMMPVSLGNPEFFNHPQAQSFYIFRKSVRI